MWNSGKLVQTATVITLLIALTAGSAAAILGMGKYEKVKAVNGVVSIPLAKMSAKARHYKFESGGKEIAFFVVKAGDGSIRSAFDACDVCYQEKKGYEQQGDAMLCRNCNKKFAVNRIGPHETGGCNPSSLAHTEANGSVMIRVEDLQAGARLF